MEVALRRSSCAPDWEHRRGLEEEVDVARRVKRVPERVCIEMLNVKSKSQR